MKRIIYIILLILSVFLAACSDALFEDMDNAINNSQMPGGVMTIDYRTGMVLDGDKDTQYDDVNTKVQDVQDDQNLSYAGTDLKEIILVQDDTSIWLYATFWDGSPAVEVTTNHAVGLCFGTSGGCMPNVQVIWTGGDTNIAISTGVEIKILKTDIDGNGFNLGYHITNWAGGETDTGPYTDFIF
jgi:hypothetical protein